MAKIPVAGPWVTDREVEYTADAARNAWYAGANEYIHRFESGFAAHTGRRHAVSLPHCTAGLHLALAALGVGPGDEVIVPDATWIATCAPITYVGATPVFADVDADTWCLSPASFAANITNRTKAVIGVDLYGSMADWTEIERIARERGIHVIEDAAEAVGSTLGGRPAGAFGKCSVFSFHGSKTLTTGEGGLLAIDDTALFERVMFLRDHGRVPGDRFFFNAEVAFKYKMSALQAAFGLAQLERVEELVERKRQIFGWYSEELTDLTGVRLNAEPAGTRNSYWMVTVVLDPSLGTTAKDLMSAFDAKEIDSRPFFHPLSSVPALRDLPTAARAREQNRVAHSIAPYGLNLPSAMNLSRDDVRFVCDVLRTTLKASRS